ncbi:hypothetical protein [Halalkalicoccus tibetensis]|uniref:Uncharacterized protein n=1 Tax=Halalkalicoccus tibetensis TaxID=175632 RepID=A0ABD5V9U1_9EURY
MIDQNYPPSPLDPPFSLRGRSEGGAFRAGESLVVHRGGHRAWIRSDASVGLEERR